MNETTPSKNPHAIYCIRDWAQTYESDRTANVKEPTWFKLSNRLDGDVFLDVVDHKDGACHWGCWVALCMIASRATPRGCLLRDAGEPHTAETVARQSRISKEIFRDAFQRFIEMGLLVATNIPLLKQPAAKTKVNGKHEEESMAVPVVDSGFPQWWIRWCEGTKRSVGKSKAETEFNHHVAPLQDRAPFEACFASYLRSGDIARGAAMNPARWIRENAKDAWIARWPEQKKTRGEEIEDNLRRMHE